MVDDDIVYPVTSNEDLIAVGLSPEHDNDVRDAAAALFGVDVGSVPAPIDLDGDDAGWRRWRLGRRWPPTPTAQTVTTLQPLLLWVSASLLSGLILRKSMWR
jgi:hypothetical protein